MNPALQTVLDYVVIPKPGFAALITGPWGCGKTYFWKHVVEPELNQRRKSKHIFYASLYGVKDARSIDTQLLSHSSSELVAKKFKRLAKLLPERLKRFGPAGKRAAGALLNRFTGFDISSLDLRWLIDTEDAVVCFDDLERCEMPLEEILGYVNHFVEHCGSSVIVICNEDEIGSDKERKEEYKQMKEKVIGFSFTYKPDYDDVLASLRAPYQKDNTPFYEYLTENQILIRDLFLRSESDNIRAMHKTLIALQVIFDTLCSGGIDAKSITKHLVYVVVPTGLELHVGRGDSDALKRIHSFRSMITHTAFDSLWDSEKTCEASFVDRYFLDADKQYAVGCLPVCDYLLTGHLDRPSLIQQMKELFLPDTTERKRYEPLIADPMSMDDDEFQRATDQTLEQIKEGQVTKPGVLVGLFDAFQNFVNYGLISHTSDEVIQAFREGLRRCAAQGTFEGDPLFTEAALSHPSLNPPTEPSKVFRKEVLEENRGALRLKDEKRVLEAASEMTRDPRHFIGQLVSGIEPGLRYAAVFAKLDAKEVINWVIGLSNNLKNYLRFALKARYDSPPPDRTFVAEIATLKAIRDGLKAHSEEVTDGTCTRVSEVLVQRLVETLTQAIERIQEERPD